MSHQPDETACQSWADDEVRPGVSVATLAAIYALDSVRGFGPQKFRSLYESGVLPAQALADPSLLPVAGKRGDKLRQEMTSVSEETRWKCEERAQAQVSTAMRLGAAIVTYGHRAYPPLLQASRNAVPVLYVSGPDEILAGSRTVACVGSRGIREPYTILHRGFAEAAVVDGFTIVSGFALGADTIGHTVAVSAGGKTICVLPSGLDRPFPPENRELFRELRDGRSAVLMSEFPFGTGASSLTLRKRNKTIVALSLGVLVSQSAEKGGAMNAFRFAIEEHRPVATFESDGTEEASGNGRIAAETKVPVAVFSTSSARQAYHEWLRMLSSSI